MKQLQTDFFIHENDYSDLDESGAVHRLSQAIACKTINYADHSLTDYEEFDRLQANNPSATAKRDGYGYHALIRSMARYFGGVVFVPSMTVGATDAHQYEQICDTCLRCSPFMAEPEERTAGVHGTNERISVQSYMQGIRVLIDLMTHANVLAD